MDHAAPDVVRLSEMKITLELDEEQSWLLVASLGRAWADAMARTQYKAAEDIITLQKLVQEHQDAAYTLLRTSPK
jgi:fructose-bisphosphate aldolase class 1